MIQWSKHNGGSANTLARCHSSDVNHGRAKVAHVFDEPLYCRSFPTELVAKGRIHIGVVGVKLLTLTAKFNVEVNFFSWDPKMGAKEKVQAIL